MAEGDPPPQGCGSQVRSAPDADCHCLPRTLRAKGSVRSVKAERCTGCTCISCSAMGGAANSWTTTYRCVCRCCASGRRRSTAWPLVKRWPLSGLLSAPMTDSRLQWFTRRATVRESASPYRPFRLLPRTLRPLQPLPGLRNSGHSLCPFLARRGAIVSGFLRRPGSERLF
jgi:hypothetical protein